MAATKMARLVAAGVMAAAIALTSLGGAVSAALSATNFDDDKEHAVSVFAPVAANTAVTPVVAPVLVVPIAYADNGVGQIDNSGDR